ncbi:hypothetical protein GEMRC1_014150 [Eukaryota sp. GEM-RC1]
MNRILHNSVIATYPYLIAGRASSVARSVRHLFYGSSNLGNVFSTKQLLKMTSEMFDSTAKDLYVDALSDKVSWNSDYSRQIRTSLAVHFRLSASPSSVFEGRIYRETNSLAGSFFSEASSFLNEYPNVQSLSRVASFLTSNSVSFNERAILDSTKLILDSKVLNSLNVVVFITAISSIFIIFIWSYSIVVLPALDQTSNEISRWLHLLLLLPGECLQLMAGVDQMVKIKPEPELDTSESSSSAVRGIPFANNSSSSSNPKLGNVPSSVSLSGSIDDNQSKEGWKVSSLLMTLKAVLLLVCLGLVTVIVIFIRTTPSPVKSLVEVDQELLGAVDIRTMVAIQEFEKNDAAWGFGSHSIDNFLKFWDFRVDTHVLSSSYVSRITSVVESRTPTTLGDIPNRVTSLTNHLLKLDQFNLIGLRLFASGLSFPDRLLGTFSDYSYTSTSASEPFSTFDDDSTLPRYQQRDLAREVLVGDLAEELKDRLIVDCNRLFDDVYTRFQSVYSSTLSTIVRYRNLVTVLSISCFGAYFVWFFISLTLQSFSKHRRSMLVLFTLLLGVVLAISVTAVGSVKVIVERHESTMESVVDDVIVERELVFDVLKYINDFKSFAVSPSTRNLEKFKSIRNSVIDNIETYSKVSTQLSQLDEIFVQTLTVLQSTLATSTSSFNNLTWDYVDPGVNYHDHAVFGFPRSPFVYDPSINSTGRCWLTTRDLDLQLIPSMKKRLSLCVLMDEQVITLISEVRTRLVDGISELSTISNIYDRTSILHVNALCNFAMVAILFYFFVLLLSNLLRFKTSSDSNLIPKNSIKCGTLNESIVNSMAGKQRYRDVGLVYSTKKPFLLCIFLSCLILAMSPIALLAVPAMKPPIHGIHCAIVSSLRSNLVANALDQLESAQYPVFQGDDLAVKAMTSSLGLIHSGSSRYGDQALETAEFLSHVHDSLVFGGDFDDFSLPPSIGQFPLSDSLTFGFPLSSTPNFNFIPINSDISEKILEGGIGALLSPNVSASSVASLPLKGTWFHRSVDVGFRHFIDRLRYTAYSTETTGTVPSIEGLASLGESVQSALDVSTAVFLESLYNRIESAKSFMMLILFLQFILLLLLYFRGYRRITKVIAVEENTLHQLLLLIPNDVVASSRVLTDELS